MISENTTVVVTASTFPTHDSDHVPDFVLKQLISLNDISPNFLFIAHYPHHSYGVQPKRSPNNESFIRYPFHYFWPFKFELLAGRGILPSLKANWFLILLLPSFLVFQLLSLFLLVRKTKPSLIYAHWFTPQAISAYIVSTITKTPMIFTTHTSDVNVLGSNPMSKLIVRTICNHSACFTAVSNTVMSHVEKLIPKPMWSELRSKAYVIPMGALDYYRPKSKTEKDVFKILYLGRLSEKKGVSYLVNAFNQFSKEVRCTLTIAGDGPELINLKRLARNHDLLSKVSFVGHVSGERKQKLLLTSDCICIPSIITKEGDQEGFPVVALESFSAKLLTLVSDQSGLSQIVSTNNAGLTFRAKSSKSIYKSLRCAYLLSTEEMKLLTSNARRLYLENYSWQIVAKKYARIIENAAKQNPNS